MNRDLNAMLRPRSIVLVGATDRSRWSQNTFDNLINRKYPGEVHLVTIGPLSTIGELVVADPGWANGVASLTVMGGAVGSHGNALPARSASIRCPYSGSSPANSTNKIEE